MATVKLDPAKGVQIPNLTTTERNAISSPETGALIWNTTTSAINQYNGSAWEATDTNTQADITGKLNLSGGTMTGTVISPSFTSTAGGTFTTAAGNDLNIVYPDTRSLFIKEAGTTHVTVDNTGKVGIGGSPTNKLHIRNDGTTQRGDLRLGDAGGTTYWDIGRDNASTGDFTIFNQTDEKLRILSSGGLTFNGDTAAANALDDYEEGTWTPLPKGHTGSAGSHAHNMTGKYTKVGNVVTATAYGYMTNKGSWTGKARLYGLPFTVNLQASHGSMGMYPAGEVDAAWRTALCNENVTYMQFMKGTWMDLTEDYSDWDTGRYLSITITYFTNS